MLEQSGENELVVRAVSETDRIVPARLARMSKLEGEIRAATNATLSLFQDPTDRLGVDGAFFPARQRLIVGGNFPNYGSPWPAHDCLHRR